MDMTDPSAFTFVAAVLLHTPPYVWGLLAALVIYGRSQMKDREIHRNRIIAVPLVLATLSLAGAVSAFGVAIGVIAGWLGGAIVSALATRWLIAPAAVPTAIPVVDASGAARYRVRGSAIPLALMLAVFVLRYSVAVALATHPLWAREPLVQLAASLGYGALCGIFVGRAWRMLARRAHAPSHPALAAR